MRFFLAPVISLMLIAGSILANRVSSDGSRRAAPGAAAEFFERADKQLGRATSGYPSLCSFLDAGKDEPRLADGLGHNSPAQAPVSSKREVFMAAKR